MLQSSGRSWPSRRCVSLLLRLRLRQAKRRALSNQAITSRPEVVQRDLDALYEALQTATVDLYAFRSKADYDAYHAGLRASVTSPMSRLDAALLFQRLAGFARVGHIRSNSWLNEVFGTFGEGAQFAPIFIRVEPTGRVFLSDTANADGTAPAGAQLLAINDEPIARVLARMTDFVSGERTSMAHTILEDFFPALFWTQNRDAKAFTLELLVRGERVTATVPTMTFGEYRAMDTGVPSPGTDFNTREFRMIDQKTGYLRPGPFGAVEGEEPVDGLPEAAMIAFLDASFESLLASGANDLIIDLRNNSGGDIAFSDPMIAWFASEPFRFSSSFTLRASAAAKAHYERVAPINAAPDADISPFLARLASEERAQENGALYPFEIPMVSLRKGARFEGRVWVLINRKSYSNATSTAALIKDYGFGTIMGEETADVPTSFASIIPFVLPETGFTVDLPKSYFVRPSGDETVRGVIPEIALPRQEIGSAQDTMLNAALEVIRTGR